MKRIVKNQSVPVLLAPQKKPVMRKCTRPDCIKDLTKQQKKYCSHECRNLVLKGGTPGGGMPTMYKPEFAGVVFNDFLEYCKTGNATEYMPTDSSFLVVHNSKIPNYDQFCEYLIMKGHVPHISEDTIKHWGGLYPDFARCLDRMHRVQRLFLLDHGLSGRFNSKIAGLLLGANHGIIEKKEVDVSHKLLGVVKHLYAKTDQLEADNKKVHEQPQA